MRFKTSAPGQLSTQSCCDDGHPCTVDDPTYFSPKPLMRYIKRVLRIATHTHLAHSPEQVWTVLSDLRRYSEWNPLNVAADGEAQTNALVAMAFIDPGHEGLVMRQEVRITAADPPSKQESR